MKRLTAKVLKQKKVPGVLIMGMLAAMAMGWEANNLMKTKDYYQLESVFPKSGVAEGVIDGDNLYLENGQSIRLIGINAPERGKENFDKAKEKLGSLVTGKKVYLEYDRTQDDQFGRIMAWVWVDCEATPKLLAWDYMRLGYNKSREGLNDNPEGCKKGKLANEEIVKAGLAEVLNFKGRGKLKYEARLFAD